MLYLAKSSDCLNTFYVLRLILIVQADLCKPRENRMGAQHMRTTNVSDEVSLFPLENPDTTFAQISIIHTRSVSPIKHQRQFIHVSVSDAHSSNYHPIM